MYYEIWIHCSQQEFCFFLPNSSFCRDGRAEGERMIVRSHLICIEFNTSEIGHENVLWQKQPNFLHLWCNLSVLHVTKKADPSNCFCFAHIPCDKLHHTSSSSSPFIHYHLPNLVFACLTAVFSDASVRHVYNCLPLQYTVMVQMEELLATAQ